MTMSNSGEYDCNEAYVEITLDISDDSVAIHSIQGELCSQVKKALENKTSSSTSRSSSVGFSLFGNSSWNMKKASEELKRHLAWLTKKPSASRRFHQTKSAAFHALKGLKFIG